MVTHPFLCIKRYRKVPYFYIYDRYMSGMGKTTCSRCGTDGLGWSQEYHRLTGKWKLENHQGCTLL